MEWTRKLQIDSSGQARITLPRRWVENMELEDKEEISVRLGEDWEELIVAPSEAED